HASGRQSNAGARTPATVFNPVLPALRAGLSDRDAAKLHHTGKSEPLPGAHKRAGVSVRAPARDQTGLIKSNENNILSFCVVRPGARSYASVREEREGTQC